MDASTSPWHGRRVLVTGCTGFLGSGVTRELLDRGAEVVGLIREHTSAEQYARECAEKRFHVVRGRVEDAIRLHTAMAVHDISAVFHFAGESDRGTDAVTRAAALHDPRMPVVMARPAGELRLAPKQESTAAMLGVARFGELFGPRDRKESRVVPRSVLALLRGETATGANGPAREFVYVRDAAYACLAVATAMEREARRADFTFRSGWEFTESAMAALVADVCAGRTPEVKVEAPDNPLGWKPETTLVEALAETIRWYRQGGPAHRRFAGRKAA